KYTSGYNTINIVVITNNTMDSSWNLGVMKAIFDAIKMEVHRMSELIEKVMKILFRLMDEMPLVLLVWLDQTTIVSGLERLSKMLQEAACGGHEKQLERLRRMQQDAL
ncbi:hypothetical protein Tco_0022544, partial [Tanacetum coccineum]